MNPQSNVLSDIPAESSTLAHAAISFPRRFYWSVRRELWEHRSVYLAPLIAAALILVGFLIGMFQLRRHIAPDSLNPPTQQAIFQGPYNVAALVLMGVTFIVAVFYSLDALYGERRDRSILFWKSLPVSDLTAVLSKATIPLVILPLLTFAITILLQGCMLLGVITIFAGSGLNADALGNHAPSFAMSLMLLYHLVAIHGLWFAPIYGWLLLVSAWARRTPLLWAVLPPLGIIVVEHFAFNTKYFAGMLKNRFSGAPGANAFTSRDMAMNPLTHLAVADFLASPGLWLGLAVAAAFLAGAIYVRRRRDPM